ncbi:MAG: hypothetical protein AB7O24_25790 [Kofleriaceae bacterium]
MRIINFAMAGALALIGCDKARPEGGVARDQIVDAWKKAGLPPSKLAAATTPVGTDCQTGSVQAIDVLLCVFPTEVEAKAAETAGLTWVGDASGLAKANGNVLIALVDRKNKEPAGKTIDRLVKLASN